MKKGEENGKERQTANEKLDAHENFWTVWTEILNPGAALPSLVSRNQEFSKANSRDKSWQGPRRWRLVLQEAGPKPSMPGRLRHPHWARGSARGT